MSLFVYVLTNYFSNFFCRYHYNVSDARLQQHIDKGYEDGLYISCVASSANLWALIMDAGTGFCSQVYELSPVFLHKVCQDEDVIRHAVIMFLWVLIIFLPSNSFTGLDYGAVGKELLYKCNSWCYKWEFIGCYV